MIKFTACEKKIIANKVESQSVIYKVTWITLVIWQYTINLI